MSTGFSSAFLVTALLFADDGTGNVIDNVYVGTGTLSTYLTEVDNSNPGFKPDLVILAAGPVTANDAHEADARISIGAAERTSDTNFSNTGAASWFSLHNVDTSETASQCDANYPNTFIDNTTNVKGAVQVYNADTSGFSYRQIDTDGQAFDFGYICFAGSAFSNLDVDQHGLSTIGGTGDVARTGAGFQPGCAFQVQSGARTAGNTLISSPSPRGYTIASFDSSNSYLHNIIAQDNVDTSDTGNMSKHKAVFNQNDLTDLYNEATFVSFDADGWTLNYTTSVGINAAWSIAFDSQEPVAPASEEEETVTASTPAGSRDTRLSLAAPAAGTTKTQWEITPSGESAFTITTTSSGTDSANVSDSDLQTLDIWLPPSHSYTLRTRHFTSGSWGAWSASSEFTSRGTLNSYEKYLALSGLGGVDNVETS